MWLRLVALASVPPTVWALARFDVLPHVSLCMFQVATGRPCPGCGMTRSMLRLSQGDLVASLRFHPLGIVLAGLFFAALGGTAVGLVRGGDPVADFLARRGTWLVLVVVIALLLVWAVRCFLVPGWAPDPVR